MDRIGRAVAATLVVGLAVLVVALIVTLSHVSTRRAGTNGIQVANVLGVTPGGGTFCQPRELIPAGTGATRLSLKAVGGPGTSVGVDVTRGHATLAGGTRRAGWTGESVTVPLRAATTRDVFGSVCITLGAHARTALGGQKTAPRFAAASGNVKLAGRLRIEYLRPGRASWWAFASTVGHRIGLGRAPAGPWAALLALTFMLTAIALGSWRLVHKEP